MLKIKQKCFNLASFKLEFLKIGLMNLRFLKACGSGRLWDTFQSQVCFTVHGNKIFTSKKVLKYTCLPSFIVEWLYLNNLLLEIPLRIRVGKLSALHTEMINSLRMFCLSRIYHFHPSTLKILWKYWGNYVKRSTRPWWGFQSIKSPFSWVLLTMVKLLTTDR